MWADSGPEAVAIDPGGAANAMADFIERSQLQLAAILLTHAHIDHIEGIGKLNRRSEAPVYLHPDDRRFYDNAQLQAVQFGMAIDPLPEVDGALLHGHKLKFGGLGFEVRHVPGHSPGHVLLYAENANVAFIGDVVFQGSIGRTDLPGGNYQELMRSIRQQVLTLPDNTLLYSGHGPPTTVGQERVSNPFLAPSFGGGLA